MKNIYTYILSVLFIISIIVLLSLLHKEHSDMDARKVIEIPVENCHPQHQKCEILSGDFKFNLLIDKNVYYLKPFNIHFWSENNTNHNIESILLNFKMQDMDMGINRIRLKKLNTQNGEITWSGKGLLPVCVTGRADWISEVEILTKQNKYTFNIPLLVKRQ